MDAMKRFLSYVGIFAQASVIVFEALFLGMVMAEFIMRSSEQTVEQGYKQKIKDSVNDAIGLHDISSNNFRTVKASLTQEFIIFLIVTGIVSVPLIVFGLYIFLREKRNVLFPYVYIVGYLVSIRVLQELVDNYFVTKVKSGIGHRKQVQKEKIYILNTQKAIPSTSLTPDIFLPEFVPPSSASSTTAELL